MHLFRGDEHTFHCDDHSVPFMRLTKVAWSVASGICAAMDINYGVIKRTLYCDRLRGRAILTPDNLTISSLLATDEGVIQCLVEDDFKYPFIQANMYYVTIKGE